MMPAAASSLLLLGQLFAAAPPPETSKILGILQRRCVECHGPSKQSAKLRLDSLDNVFRGGRSGPAVTAGKSAESVLYLRVSSRDPDERMPPEGDPLGAEEIGAVRAWIDGGAKSAREGKAASGPGAGSAIERVETRPELLPTEFRPAFCVAGDPSGPKLAVGRGAEVEVYEVAAEPDAQKGAGGGPKAAPIATLRGHADVVQSVAFSSNGGLLATGDFRAVRVWETVRFGLVRTLAPHADRVLTVVFSPSGDRIAAGGGVPTENGEVKVWRVDTGTELWTSHAHSDTVLALAWSGDGTRLLTGGADRVSYVLDAAAGTTVRRLEAHTHHVLAVAVSADGKRAATAGADRRILEWDLEKGEHVKTARGHEKPVTSVAFYSGGKSFASTSGDGQVRFWEWRGDDPRFNFGDAKGYLQGGAFLDGERKYAAAEQDGTVRVYDVAKKQLLLTIGAGAP